MHAGDRPAIIAPPESEWYHGRLDRYSSEQRLRNTGKLGCYLVRESDRKPGSYVLSYLGRTGINHFRFDLLFVCLFCHFIAKLRIRNIKKKNE